MTITLPIIFIIFLILFIAFLAGYFFYIQRKKQIYEAKSVVLTHTVAQTKNFINIFSQSLKSVEQLESIYSTTARYFADLLEADSLCIFIRDGEHLKAEGISGAFPPLHKSNEYVLTKPKYILQSLRKEKIKIGEGIIGKVAANREYLFLKDAAHDPRIYELGNVTPIKTMMAVPVLVEGGVAGVICAVNNRNSDQPFSKDQMGKMKNMASQVLIAQNIIDVYHNMSKQQRLDQEVEFAREIQASLLPESFPEWQQYKVHAFSRPAKEVSGDFYDWVEIDDDRLLIIVGDACGKGIPACMIMAMTRSFIRSSTEKFTTLKDLLVDLNDNLFRDIEDERFITLACCLLDKGDSSIEYARAGHTGLMVSSGNHCRTIYPDGPGLGLLPRELAVFETIKFTFHEKMTILLYTDGITEELHEEEEFGDQRLIKAFHETAVKHKIPDKMVGDILDGVDKFTEKLHEQADDQTLLIIKHQ